MQDPQFSGQTKERLSSRQIVAYVSGEVKDAFSLWLNKHTDEGELLAELVINHAQKRLRAGKKVIETISCRLIHFRSDSGHQGAEAGARIVHQESQPCGSTPALIDEPLERFAQHGHADPVVVPSWLEPLRINEEQGEQAGPVQAGMANQRRQPFQLRPPRFAGACRWQFGA